MRIQKRCSPQRGEKLPCALAALLRGRKGTALRHRCAKMRAQTSLVTGTTSVESVQARDVTEYCPRLACCSSLIHVSAAGEWTPEVNGVMSPAEEMSSLFALADSSARRHILSVVLEDYCHVGPVSRFVSPGYWHRFESRVQRNTDITLDLLDEVGAKATFFVLGWIGEHQPEVVAEVARRGHEIASKGYFHRSIRDLTPELFREDVRRSRDALETAANVPVRGFRMPRGGFGKGDLWALDVLAEEGFEYDSSLRPFGIEFADQPFRRFIHRHEHAGRCIWEVPLSTWKLGPLTVPISGGNYVRQLPDAFTRRAIAHWVKRQTSPLVFYFHIWELDPEQPRISAVSMLERIRQYRNLDAMGERIRHYLRAYKFGTIAQYLRLPEATLGHDPERQSAAVAHRASKTGMASSAPAPEPVRVEGSRAPVSVVIPCFNEEATLGYWKSVRSKRN